MIRLALAAILTVFSLSLGFAQTAETPKPAPEAAGQPPELPPDVKAYRDILKETDPEKKIAALEKWKAEFPESNMRETADSNILHTVVTRLPSQHDRIRKVAAAMYN